MHSKVDCSFKNRIGHWLLVGIFASFTYSAGAAEDKLFSKIQMIQFENGFTAVLAPSDEARIVSLELQVEVGWDVETKDNFGVSHLLEHSLFRDSKLADDLTYLQVIEEKGGAANGFTYPRKTVYKATIGKNKADWLIDLFYKMLTKRNFLQEHIDKEKDTVLLEIGKPGVLAELLGFDLWASIKPRSLELPDFWESEYNVKFDSHEFTRDEERLSTLRLRADQVNKHYVDYYHPANMRLIIAGKFDPQHVQSLLAQTWKKLPKNPDGKILPPIGKPVPSSLPYIRTRSTPDFPSITYGTKVWELTRPDEEILESYVNYLSHKLMKELRNKKGQTYTVSPSTSFQDRFGYALISFQTPPENFRNNLREVKSLINKHTLTDGLSEVEFNEAKDLYLKRFELNDGNSDVMLRTAELYHYFYKQYKDVRSPEEVLGPINLEAYNQRLKEIFKPNHRYSYNYVPPYFFRYENFVLMIFVMFTMLLGVQKKLLLKPFDHARIRWMRNIRYIPFKAVECMIIAGLLYVFVFLEFYIIDLPFYRLSFLNDSLLFAEYLPNILSIILLTGTTNWGLAAFPRRAYIIGNTLILKSLTYYSYHIPLNLISSLEVKSPYSLPIKPSLLWKIKTRFIYFGPPWKPGLILNLKNGKTWYLGVSEPSLAAKEIQSLISNQDNKPNEKQVA